MSNTDALEVHRFSSVFGLGEAFRAGELTEADARVLLARKPDTTVRQIGYLLADWKATKAFEAKHGPSRRWGR
jgi:hypothetical protein